MSDTKQHQPADHYKGWLFKWTNYIKGYQRRWFVLQNGYLSYYRNQAEMSNACRGTINLANSFIHTQDSCSFVISNSGAMTFHLKAASEVDRQRWVTALELAKSKAITIIESDEDEELAPLDKNELQNTLKMLSAKLEDLKTCNELITKHGAGLQRAVVELEAPDSHVEATTRIRAVNEKATVFRIASNAMISACNEYVELASTQGTRWQKLLQYEHEQRVYLEDMVEQLGKQHSNLEKQIRKSLNPTNNGAGGGAGGQGNDPGEVDDDEEDFYDAVGDDDNSADQRFDFKSTVTSHDMIHTRGGGGAAVRDPSTTSSTGTADNDSSDTDTDVSSTTTGDNQSRLSGDNLTSSNNKNKIPLVVNNQRAIIPAGSVRVAAGVKGGRRQSIPERPNFSVNLWGIMKNCIGKDLSKIPMPVNFSEPLSFLQRLTEDFEYSDCLDAAAGAADDHLQMSYVAAFTVSSYANTTLRTGKPFNPLLGETFECDRLNDLGWKSFAEQVSHHPPMVAMHTEGNTGWVHWQEFTMSSKFRGKYLQIIPLGIAHLLFPKSGNHYTWRKVTTTVHNIIVGRLWVDNHGEMDITNHRTGDHCHLKYYAYSYFSREAPRKVSGLVADKSGATKYVLNGTWDDKLEGAKVLSSREPTKGNIEYETGENIPLWQRRIRPVELEKCYNFTQLAVELNEPEEGTAPTDSRNRPDQRLMEEGRWDEANDTKVMLEEKQRASRKAREQQLESAAQQGKEVHWWEPKWFKKEADPQTGNLIHVFNGEYWRCKERQDWSRCPDIYLSDQSDVAGTTISSGKH